MNCVYCEQPLPDKWYESHCIPVTRQNGEWIDMYNRLGEWAAPHAQAAHWACHLQDQADRHASPRHGSTSSGR